MQPSPHHISIFGQYKTGTTALFYRLLDGLPANTRTLFEPKSFPHADFDHSKPILAKVILGLAEGPDRVRYEDFSTFPFRILLLRDPRDRIVSGTLFICRQAANIYGKESNLSEILSILRRKESDPRSLPTSFVLGEILRLAGGLSLPAAIEELAQQHRWIYEFELGLGDHLQLKYEDLVDGRLAPVEAYLGLSLRPNVDVGSEHGHVTRTKTHGDWKNWFTDEDIDLFKPVVDEYLQRFGYPNDWTPAAEPVIRKSDCSGYVKRTARERAAAIER